VPIANVLRIKVSRALLASLTEMFERTQPSGDAHTVEMFAAQLLEVVIADFRARQIPEVFPLAPPNQPRIERTIKKRGLTPAQVQVLLHLRNQHGQTIEALALRFATSKTSITRIIERYEKSEHVKLSQAGGSRKLAEESKISLPGSLHL